MESFRINTWMLNTIVCKNKAMTYFLETDHLAIRTKFELKKNSMN